MQEVKFEKYHIKNEPVLKYERNSKERKVLLDALEKTAKETVNIPIVIGSEEIFSGIEKYQVMPHDNKKKIAKFYWADEKTIRKAIDVSVAAQQKWDRTSIEERIKIWEKAAEMMATKYRQELNAATMLGQAKTVIQAEIDSAAELIDFIR